MAHSPMSCMSCASCALYESMHARRQRTAKGLVSWQRTARERYTHLPPVLANGYTGCSVQHRLHGSTSLTDVALVRQYGPTPSTKLHESSHAAPVHVRHLPSRSQKPLRCGGHWPFACSQSISHGVHGSALVQWAPSLLWQSRVSSSSLATSCHSPLPCTTPVVVSVTSAFV